MRIVPDKEDLWKQKQESRNAERASKDCSTSTELAAKRHRKVVDQITACQSRRGKGRWVPNQWMWVSAWLSWYTYTFLCKTSTLVYCRFFSQMKATNMQLNKWKFRGNLGKKIWSKPAKWVLLLLTSQSIRQPVSRSFNPFSSRRRCCTIVARNSIDRLLFDINCISRAAAQSTRN